MRNKLIILGLAAALVSLGSPVLAQSLNDMGVFRTNDANATEAKKLVWQTFCENDWTGLITSFNAPDRNSENYVYLEDVSDYQLSIYNEITAMMALGEGDWEGREIDRHYAKFLTALSKAIKELYGSADNSAPAGNVVAPSVIYSDYDGTKPVAEQVDVFDVCNTRKVLGPSIKLYEEGVSSTDEALKNEIKSNSVRLLYNKVVNTKEYFDSLLPNDTDPLLDRRDTYSFIDVTDSGNPGFKIFVQGIVSGNGYIRYCIENGLTYESEEAKNYLRDRSENEKFFADKVCEYYKTVRISYVTD